MDPDPPHLVVTDPDGSPIEISAARKDPRTDLRMRLHRAHALKTHANWDRQNAS